MLGLEGAPQWPVADDHAAHGTARPLDLTERGDGQRDVLLGRHPANVEDDQIALGRAPRRAQGRRATPGREDSRVHAATNHAEILEAGSTQPTTQLRAGDERAERPIVESTEIAEPQGPQPAGTIMA